MTQHLVTWDTVPETVEANGVGKRRIEIADRSLTMVRIPAGTSAPRHSHPFDQFVQVTRGEGTLGTEQGKTCFGPGSIFVLPRDTWHTADFDIETILIESNLPS